MASKSLRKSKRKQLINLITHITFSLLTLSALTGCIILLLQNYSLRTESREVSSQLEEMQNQYLYTQEDLTAYSDEAALAALEQGRGEVLDRLKASITEGNSVSDTLRELYPEDVIVYADGGYQFFPISDTLNKHHYTYENFIAQENGEIIYTDEEEKVLSQKGIDVSRHQGEINWRQVAGDQVSYAFIRAGYRGMTEGSLVEDEYFQDNMKGALANGIDVGVYFYTQAITTEEAIEEAEFVLDLIRDYDITYPVVLDLEETTDAQARTGQMTQEEYTKAAVAFCERIQEAGYTPMIYGNLKTFMIMLDLEQIEAYEKWFAYYDTELYFPYDFSIWQYSSKGSVSGIQGDVDLNISMKDFAE